MGKEQKGDGSKQNLPPPMMQTSTWSLSRSTVLGSNESSSLRRGRVVVNERMAHLESESGAEAAGTRREQASEEDGLGDVTVARAGAREARDIREVRRADAEGQTEEPERARDWRAEGRGMLGGLETAMRP